MHIDEFLTVTLWFQPFKQKIKIILFGVFCIFICQIYFPCSYTSSLHSNKVMGLLVIFKAMVGENLAPIRYLGGTFVIH